MQFITRNKLPPDNPIYRSFAPARGTSSIFEGFVTSYQNSSETNVPLSKPEGWLIVPSHLPANIDFEATTFGSLTKCDVVTHLCDIVFHSNNTNDKDFWLQNVTYDCKHDTAGLDLRGNFSDVGNSAKYSLTDTGYALEFYTDSTRSIPMTDATTATGPTFWYAALLQVNRGFLTSELLVEKGIPGVNKSSSSITPLFGLVANSPFDNDVQVSSILSCTTTLSDVVRPITGDQAFLISHNYTESLHMSRPTLSSTVQSMLIPGRPPTGLLRSLSSTPCALP